MSTKPCSIVVLPVVLVLGLALSPEPSYACHIERVVPDQGVAGTMVAVYGHGFADQVRVWVGGIDRGVHDTVSSECVAIEVPDILSYSHRQRDIEFEFLDLRIENIPGHQVLERADAFKYWYTPPQDGWPVIDRLEPDAGPAGTGVTIYGDNFGPEMVVFFGCMPALPVEFVSKTELRVEAPPLPLGLILIEIYPPPPVTVGITVVNLETGLWDWLNDGFTYGSAGPDLAVDAVIPDSGPPGIEATVVASGFGEDVEVYFGFQQAAIIDRPSLDEIVVEVPPFPWHTDNCDPVTGGVAGCWEEGEQNGDECRDEDCTGNCPRGHSHTVPVTVADTATGVRATLPHAFTYVLDPCPAVIEVVPDEGAPGMLTTVVVRGFSEAAAVYFGGRNAPVVERPSLEEIVVEVPPFGPAVPVPCNECVYKTDQIGCDDDDDEPDNPCGDPCGTCLRPKVSVTVADLITGAGATKRHAFTYVLEPVPVVEGVVPDRGYPGMVATVTVCGFSEAVSVYFGLQTATVVERPSLEEIVVEVPPRGSNPCWTAANHVDDGAILSCNDDAVDCTWCCPGGCWGRAVSVTVVDTATGAWATRHGAFKYIETPAVGILAIMDTEVQPETDTVSIPILLDYHTAAGGRVSTILFALEYNHAVIEITDVVPGPAALDPGKEVRWNIDGAGLLRVAIAEGQAEIPQGQVCFLDASISADAARGAVSVLRFEELSASAPDGTEVEFDGRPGLVRLGTAYDVNDDGTVNAVDVQRVVNIALHIAVAEAGPQLDKMADGDGDGDVDAVDIQRAINKALGMV